MYLSPILLFFISTIITAVLYKLVGKNFALDSPNFRKQHAYSKPQIGGIVFGSLLLLIGWGSGLAPAWYLISGVVSILLGVIDDLRYVPWQIKLLIQLVLAIYIASVFWNRFDTIVFYNISFSLSKFSLLVIFLLWFVGVYNAINLLDGLDGLAGGFMLIICISLGLSDNGDFAKLNTIFAVLLFGFLVFNQRPSKLFMGDAGSLFLGFHTAVLPLLFKEMDSTSSVLNMTPFILIVSYLIADTTRVFFTRIANKKSPMTPDTIHFHHLLLKQSGSYLSSIASIYIITLASATAALYSFYNELSDNVMLSHLALMLFFILAPPVQTYVPIITRIVRPFYIWQKNHKRTIPFLPRTLFTVILLIGLIVSLFVFNKHVSVIYWQHGLALFMFIIFVFCYPKNKMTMYVIQLGLILFLSEIFWNIELNTMTKLFSTLLSVSYIIFSLERRAGCNLAKFSALDLLIILLTIGGIVISTLKFPVSFWFFLMLFSIWFNTSFILRRIIYFMRI